MAGLGSSDNMTVATHCVGRERLWSPLRLWSFFPAWRTLTHEAYNATQLQSLAY